MKYDSIFKLLLRLCSETLHGLVFKRLESKIWIHDRVGIRKIMVSHETTFNA